MDPKMDSGMELPAELTAGKIRVADIDSKTFGAAEIIGIIDELMSLEMSWIAGNLLCQTLFTCIYLHRPYKLKSPLLRSYIILLLKTADLIRREVTKAQLFDEEDFTTDTMGLSLCEEVQEHEALSGLLQAEDGLMIAWRKAKGRPNANDDLAVEQLVYPEGRELEYIDALLARVRFRRAFYTTVASLGKHNLPQARKSLAQAITQLKTIQNTIDFAADVQEAFDPYVTRKLFSQAPPRPITAMSKQEGGKEMSHMLFHFEEICNVSSIPDAPALLRYLDHFSGRTSCPNVLARSLMQTTILRNEKLFGRADLKDVITQTIIAFNNPPYFNSTNVNIMETVEEFLSRAVEPFRLLLKFFGYNRARQHRRLRKLVVAWNLFQEDGERMDGILQAELSSQHTPPRKGKGEDEDTEEPFYFASWVYLQKLNLMSMYLLLGYELDLYSPYEHRIIFFYLQYIYDKQEEHLTRVERTSKGGDKLRSGIETLINGVSTKELIFRGLFYVAKFLREDGQVPGPDHVAYNEQVHYGHRLTVFEGMGSPEMVPYEQFVAAVGMEDQAMEVGLRWLSLQFTVF